MRTRAFRRHHLARIRRKQRNYWGGLVGDGDHRREGICLHTPKPCGCWMCNKPRKVFGITTQEKRKRWHRVKRVHNARIEYTD